MVFCAAFVVYIKSFLVKNEHLNNSVQTSALKLSRFKNSFLKPLSLYIDVEPCMTEQLAQKEEM